MTIYVNKGGIWKTVTQPTTNVNGTWRTVIGGWVNKNGKWHRFYPGTVQASILVVAGGGGGGVGGGDEGAGGGGAGGVVLVNNVTLDANQTYSITVGAGGALAHNGTDSSVSGPLVVSSGTSLGATLSNTTISQLVAPGTLINAVGGGAGGRHGAGGRSARRASIDSSSMS